VPDVTVRRATPADHVDAMRVLEGALLDVESATVRERIDRGAVWVATVAPGDRDDDPKSAGPNAVDDGEGAPGRVVGALVLDAPDREGVAPRPEEVRPERRHVEAVAVTRRRRGRGVGRALVAACVEATALDRLSAEFRADVEPFYAALGFDIEALDDGRRRGELRVGR
jgi:GNAT superfamily N-acetyltransferase